MEPLVDGHGRHISDLRVSVTDRCNFRCQYCMPADGLPWLERSAVLTFEEIERVVRLMVRMGIEDVRLTGGEPLVRREFPRLVSMLSPIERPARMLMGRLIRQLIIKLSAYQRHAPVHVSCSKHQMQGV